MFIQLEEGGTKVLVNLLNVTTITKQEDGAIITYVDGSTIEPSSSYQTIKNRVKKALGDADIPQ